MLMQCENPFDCPEALANANYCAVRGGQVVIPKNIGEERARANREAFELLQDFIVHRPYPCVGAQAAFNQETCRFGTYGMLGSSRATAGLARDLFTFTQELDVASSKFMTYLAVFDGPADLTERAFDELLWEQLARLHVLDRRHHTWDASVSSDPKEATFAFSFAERGFYIVGMHPNSSRLARRFARPMLIFNARRQFDQLRERGAYGKMQRVIRARDEALQGSINPMLQDSGEASEARQYSGRAVKNDWKCPFHGAVDRTEPPSSSD